jgi:hypothetical protein
MNMKPILAGALMALALVPSSNAGPSSGGYIREKDGQLTTNLKGVTITPADIKGVPEAWNVDVDITLWNADPFPTIVPEPEGEPGVNLLFVKFQLNPESFIFEGALSFLWESDVTQNTEFSLTPLGVTGGGITMTWVTHDGVEQSVTFEDCGDTVPDSSSTAGLLLISCATLAFAARTRVAWALR